MYGDSILKVIINSIKNFFKIITTLVASAVTSIFVYKKNEEQPNTQNKTNKQEKTNRHRLGYPFGKTGLPRYKHGIHQRRRT